MKYTKERPEFNKYRVWMMSKESIKIDEDEFDKVMGAIQTGQMVKVRQGIINPVSISAVTFDDERYEEWKGNIQNRFTDGQTLTLYPVPEKLTDIFAPALAGPKARQIEGAKR